MNRILLQRAFMNIWDLRFIKERNQTDRGIHIHYCIWEEFDERG